MQPRFHRVPLQTKDLRRFFNGHALNYAHYKHGSEDLWKVIGGPLDKMQDFPLCHNLLGVIECHELREWNDLRPPSLSVDGFCARKSMFPPEPSQSFVDGDAAEPGRKARFAAKVFKMAKKA